ncbi:hypothetical protein GLAREA_01553 [Glarea lozoyensis ATCC 20868]|uniref:ORC6 first cyclin-like domain-containing protein n=1 Tax=Glarea lozoyensis (strain ATCC 20868 / MF5171) TaxID=1116229 RepID=S3D0T3_GLAL2|nr:uncharacterized protein GLAREA_01553 [Glarea lozoyensis ATCC 20868]EPE25641.1 hypothetical protein GLAREA_01553 [Glarea lozoyensis ATCC 20868]
MSRPIEQDLNNLIPRHPGALPPELIELARSLLAQSRIKASTLSAQEETGRTYACANIACERLKTTLDLPPVEPRPPIPPRVYTKLYKYFDRTLVPNSRRKSRNDNDERDLNKTPSGSRFRDASANSTPRSLPQRHTPSKASSHDTPRKNRTSKPGLKYASNADLDSSIPRWLAPVIRKMCTAMGTKEVIPHVMAGVESMLRLPKVVSLEPDESVLQPGHKTPALIAATWFFVLQKFRDKSITGAEFRDQRTKILDIFKHIKEDAGIAAKIGGDDDKFWEGWEDIRPLDIQSWIEVATKRDYLEMDWLTNIANEDEDENGEGLNGYSNIGVSNNTSGLAERMHIGRRMQDEYDYLSPENRAEYQRWKDSILAQIGDPVDDGVIDMDTTEG